MSTGLAFLSLGSLSFFFGSAAATEQARWGPEQWSGLLLAILSSVTAVIVTIIGNRRTAQVHEDIQLPSNGISAGALLEGLDQVQHLQGNLIAAYLAPEGAEVPHIPSASEIAREIQKLKDERR